MMANGEGWAKVNGFFKGLAGVTDTVGEIIDTGADAAEDIARGAAAINDERLDREERQQAMFLKSLTTVRGDNVQLYWAGAFVAVLAVILLARK